MKRKITYKSVGLTTVRRNAARFWTAAVQNAAAPSPPALLALTLVGLAVVFLAAGCKPKEAGTHQHETASASQTDAQLYQCSMHPNIVSEKPGTCPICAMDLQPVKQIKAKGIPGRSPVELTAQQRQLINVRLAPVTAAPSVKTLRTVGVLEHDAAKVFTVAAWTSGRIEKLYVDQPEIDVAKGDPLYAIYSPELYSTMREYVTLIEKQSDNAVVVEATETRLKLLGLSPEQIQSLKTSRRAPTAIDVPSPAAGKVMMKMVKEGDYVKTGMPLYTVVDLSSLWLIATVYEPELGLIQPGMNVVATTTTYPGEDFPGVVSVINHHIDPKARSAELRVEFTQPEQLMGMREDAAGRMRHRHRLLPDMYMNAEIQIDLGQTLRVPARAVFDTGKRQYVFVEQSEGIFVPKVIQLGAKVGDAFVVTKGLSEGERVVIDGNFLLDSESQLKAAASGSLGDEPDEAETHEHFMDAVPLPAEAGELFAPLVTDYLSIQTQLAQDSVEGVAEAVDRMRTRTELILSSDVQPPQNADEYRRGLEALKERLQGFSASDLETARTEFGEVSAAMISLIGHFPPPLDEPLVVANCPMWKKSPGNWLQAGEDLVNPFMGQKMLTCGSIETKIGGAP